MNFILRRIDKTGHVGNKIIGNSYHLIFNCEPDKDGYAVLAKGYDKNTHEEIHAFIIWNNGKDWTPLYKNSAYYIMTENGKTFDTIKYYGAYDSEIVNFKHKGTGRIEDEKDINKAQSEIDKFKKS